MFFDRLINKFNNVFLYPKHPMDSNIGNGFNITSKRNIQIGNRTHIGENNRVLNQNAKLIIGNYVLTGPEVMFITGNHRFNIVGSYMIDITEDQKQEEDDQPIIIDDDVWIGARAIILKGVTIGKGCVIAAGAIVTKDIAPYTIYYGIGKQKKRFSEKEILQHELLLGAK